MQTQIQKWGNSLGIRIPKHLADKLHFQQGTFVNLETDDNYLIISTETSELDILLDNITDSNCHHEILNDDIIPLSKLACAEGFEGDAERRTAAYSNVREDSSTASTYKSPAEVEFRRRSIVVGNESW